MMDGDMFVNSLNTHQFSEPWNWSNHSVVSAVKLHNYGGMDACTQLHHNYTNTNKWKWQSTVLQILQSTRFHLLQEIIRAEWCMWWDPEWRANIQILNLGQYVNSDHPVCSTYKTGLFFIACFQSCIVWRRPLGVETLQKVWWSFVHSKIAQIILSQISMSNIYILIHCKNKIAVLANFLATTIAWLSFLC